MDARRGRKKWWMLPYEHNMIVFILCGHNAILKRKPPGFYKSPMRDIQFHLSRETDGENRDGLREINGNVCFQQIREEFH